MLVATSLLSHKNATCSFQELTAYKAKHGNTNVRIDYEGGLGQWASRQRGAQKLYEQLQSGKLDNEIDSGAMKAPKKHRFMTKHHRDKLNSIGFQWTIYNRTGWEGKYSELCEYKEKMGHTSVPQHWPENKGLGKFVARQRYLYCQIKQGKPGNNPLAPERIAQLDAIGFDWGKVRPHTWKEDPHAEKAKGEAQASKMPFATAQPSETNNSAGASRQSNDSSKENNNTGTAPGMQLVAARPPETSKNGEASSGDRTEAPALVLQLEWN